LLADDAMLSAFGAQLDDAKSAPAIATWEEIAGVIDGQIEGVTVGDGTPEAACDAMQQEADAIGTGL
jgi:multiple sugar transport system substrate-binding protein